MTTLDQRPVSNAIDLAVRNACQSIAPTWPLDRWIAVNPFWNQRDQDCVDVAARLSATTGTRMTMSREFFRQRWLRKEIERRHLEAAVRAADSGEGAAAITADELERCLAGKEQEPQRMPLLCDLSDRSRPVEEPLPWSSMVVDQISLHLADCFDRGQVDWRAPERAPYTCWRTRLVADLSLPLRGERERFTARVHALPEKPAEVIAQLARRVELDSEVFEDYLVALLGSIRGWASWAAFASWQANLDGRAFAAGAEPIVEVLAIRCAWELLLLDEHGLDAVLPEWRMQWSAMPAERAERRTQLRRDWLLQHAFELAYQESLVAGLGRKAREPRRKATSTTPSVQAVFCIDVRSERLRRHLEASAGNVVSTHGFAGFFGLPIAHRELDAEGAPSPRLPGLLAPTIATGERAPDELPLAERRRRRLAEGARWNGFGKGPTSAFTFVESFGAAVLPRLVAKSAFGQRPSRQDGKGLTDGERAFVQPVWPESGPGSSLREQVDLAFGVLRTMGLGAGLAPLVLLTGHGSSSANNAHAAGLECGACGGNAGETNVRLLANLLNDPQVRQGLMHQGMPVPEGTRFVAGLHDTTTDEVEILDADSVPDSHADRVTVLQRWLARAGERTRAERAPSLGIDASLRPERLLRTFRRRSRDWAQTRPEWGLANNAAFVAGPRSLTRGLDLGGRVFLHDYDYDADADESILTQVLTAPVVVANWINLQYYASVVEPEQFGSGNKLLHNVVGGDLGVFEGNRGDLRIGLPRQSVHDGERLQHLPQRLTVVVAAPRDAIDRVLDEHEAPRSLVANRWLHLMRVDSRGRVEQRLSDGRWVPFEELLTIPSALTAAPAVRRPEPACPEPACPEPACPEPACPEPARPEPARPDAGVVPEPVVEPPESPDAVETGSVVRTFAVLLFAVLLRGWFLSWSAT